MDDLPQDSGLVNIFFYFYFYLQAENKFSSTGIHHSRFFSTCHAEMSEWPDRNTILQVCDFPIDGHLVITSFNYPEYNFRIPIRTFCLILIRSKVQVPNLEKTIRVLI